MLDCELRVVLCTQHSGVLLQHTCIMVSCLTNVNGHIVNILRCLIDFVSGVISIEYELLIVILQLDVAIGRAACSSQSIVPIILLHHVFLDSLRETQGIRPARLLKVCQIWNEESIGSLLIGKLVWVDVAMLAQILIKCWLSRHFARIDLLGPERMFAQMLPRDTLNRVFLK